MNNQNSHNTLFTLIAFSILLTFLGGCAQPASVAPSFALREQLQEIKQQQAVQQQQLQDLERVIVQLQQQLAGGQTLATDSLSANTNMIQQGLHPEQHREFDSPAPLPQAGTADMIRVADSATSYLTAFSHLASGQYYAAEAGFEQFLINYPDHQYAPNARFWLANAQAAQDKTSQAVSNLRQIISNPAGQEKAPAALVQLINLYQKVGLNAQADEAINQLRDNYGNTPEARFFGEKNSGLN